MALAFVVHTYAGEQSLSVAPLQYLFVGGERLTDRFGASTPMGTLEGNFRHRSLHLLQRCPPPMAVRTRSVQRSSGLSLPPKTDRLTDEGILSPCGACQLATSVTWFEPALVVSYGADQHGLLVCGPPVYNPCSLPVYASPVSLSVSLFLSLSFSPSLFVCLVEVVLSC